jgi:hypothetical protein
MQVEILVRSFIWGMVMDIPVHLAYQPTLFGIPLVIHVRVELGVVLEGHLFHQNLPHIPTHIPIHISFVSLLVYTMH